MKPAKRSVWIAGSIAVVIVCAAFAGIMYFGSSHTETMDAPKGSVYYKGTMAADIESAAHDPLKRKAGSPPPGARR